MKRLLALFVFALMLVGCHSLTDSIGNESVPENQFVPGPDGWTLSGGAYWDNGQLVMPSSGASAVYNGPFVCPAWDHHTHLTFNTTAQVYFQMIGFDVTDTARWHWEDYATGSYHYDIQDLTPIVGVVKFNFTIRPTSGAATASEFVAIDQPDSQSVPPPPPAPPDTLLKYPLFASPINLAWKATYTTQSRGVDYSMAAVRYNFTCTKTTTVTFMFDNGTASYKVNAGTHSIRTPKPTYAKTLRVKVTNSAGKRDGNDVVTGSTLLPSD